MRTARLAPAALLAAIVSCTSDGTTPPAPAVASVEISPSTQSVSVAGTATLTATPRDASGNTVGGQTISWSSANTGIVSVSSSGVVTGVSAGGPVQISASTGGKTGTAQVTVVPPPVATVTVAAPATTLAQGNTMQLSAETRVAGGQVVTGRTVTWSSSDANVAPVSATGLVTAVAVGGPVTITATSEGKQGIVTLTVTPPPVTSVIVTAPGNSLAPGTTMQLTAETRVAGGQTVTGRTIAWSSSNANIASVSSSGLVTGVAAGGPVTITATSEGVQGNVALTVTVPPVATLTVNTPRSVLPRGSTTQLTAEARDADGNVLTGRTISWATSDANIATVSNAGVVTAVAMGGPVTITASTEGKQGTVALTVTFPPLAVGWQHRRPMTITTGESATETQYSVMVTFDHAAMVAAGKSLANGDDVRIGFWNGSTWVDHDRVLDAASAWNTSTTSVWFRTQTPIAANSMSTDYHLHYGNPAAGSNAPADRNLVFLYWDDFEEGSLSKWLHADGTWANVNTRAHRGMRSLWHGAEGAEGRRIVANPALDVRDVIVDAWWNVSSLHTSFNVAQMPRFRAGTGMYYSLFCLCIGGSMGFNIASYVNDHYTDLKLPAGNPVANTWMRVGTAMHGNTYRLFFNGALVNTQNNLNAITSGNIGFDKFLVPGGNGVWIDDVVVRRYVFPEPVASVGAEQGMATAGRKQ